MRFLVLGLALCLYVGSAFAQVTTQQFTGVITNADTALATGPASNRIFLDPVGTAITGTFTVNPADLTPQVQQSDQGQYAGSSPNSSVFSITDSTNTFSLPGLVDVTLSPFTADFIYLNSTSLGEASFVVGVNPCSPSLPVNLSVFPISSGIPTTCQMELQLSDPADYFLTIQITSISGNAPPPFVPAAAQILDPSAGLLKGATIETDQTLLATGGRAVKGIAADGTAELLIRIPVQAVGDTVTATLLSDHCSDQSDPTTCTRSTSSDNDGGLFAVGTDINVPSSLASQASGTAKAGTFAFVAYRAPADFARPSNVADLTASQRPVYVQLSYFSANSAIPYYLSTPTEVSIVRPPIVLIHGYASDAKETWAKFTGLDTGQFKSFQVDYGAWTRVKSTTPPLGFDCKSPRDVNCVTRIRQSDLGFTFNTFGDALHRGVAQQVLGFIQQFNGGDNPSSIPVAGVKADIIAHSMGGLIARNWTLARKRYYSDDSYGKGRIHKLITLGTPHYGSPFASLAVRPDAQCFRNLSTESIPPRILISSAVLLNDKTVGGAVGELVGNGLDGKDMNLALEKLEEESAALPTATIAGKIDGIQGLEATVILLAIHEKCPASDPLAKRFTPSAFSTIFDPANDESKAKSGIKGDGVSTPSDGAVPLTSALWSAKATEADCDFIHCFSNYAHGKNTARLTGAAHYLPDGTALVMDRIKDLLNTSVLDSTAWGLPYGGQQ
ncbi:esterase/lipase family protein [Granulicella aggregans]|uniref:esterase/lipase family protein n=1 Tax=Granulicella aggregans TaxID=474949 RepID=UPI0021E07301|nr:hypothetical protein [Granulicella aggregans]